MSVMQEMETCCKYCTVRQELGTKLMTAIAAAFARRREYGTAEKLSDSVLTAAYAKLRVAENKQFFAEREYRDHVARHGCAPPKELQAPLTKSVAVPYP